MDLVAAGLLAIIATAVLCVMLVILGQILEGGSSSDKGSIVFISVIIVLLLILSGVLWMYLGYGAPRTVLAAPGTYQVVSLATVPTGDYLVIIQERHGGSISYVFVSLDGGKCLNSGTAEQPGGVPVVPKFLIVDADGKYTIK